MKKIKKLQQIIILTGLSFSFLFLFSFKQANATIYKIYPVNTYCLYAYGDFSGTPTNWDLRYNATSANIISGTNTNNCADVIAGESPSQMSRTILEFDKNDLPTNWQNYYMAINFTNTNTTSTTDAIMQIFTPNNASWTTAFQTSNWQKDAWNLNQFSNSYYGGTLYKDYNNTSTQNIYLSNYFKTDIENEPGNGFGFVIRSLDDYNHAATTTDQNTGPNYNFNFWFEPNKATTTNNVYIYIDTDQQVNSSTNNTLTIEYPENNSSTYPFDYWKLKATGLTTGQTYRSEIFWQVQPNLTALQNDIGTFTASASTTEFLIPKSRIGFYLPQATSAPVTATAYLENTPYYGGNLAKATTTFNLTIDPPSNTTSTFIYINLTTSTQNPNLIQPVIVNNPTIPGGTTYNHTTSTSQCSAPAGITDIGGGISYGLCETGQFLFTPSQGFTDKLQNTFSEFQTKFPFAIVFGLLNTAKANATTTEGNYDLIINIPTTNLHIPILTSTTLSKAIGSSSQQIIFTTEKNLAWITCAIGILLLII